jgi:hypothetical protein
MDRQLGASSSGDQTDKRVGGLLYCCSGITICCFHGQREADKQRVLIMREGSVFMGQRS